ncbi:MAG: peptide chain release factor N(5)-glutamine methyltransferase [Oscillospiraceae bacterium]|nr:peptide chain release factor N(5)-glutamine methyltransferase [Oscillospiraceae bacterium]
MTQHQTLQRLMRQTAERIRMSGVENAAFEAAVLLEFCSGKTRTELMLRGDESAEDSLIKSVASCADRRISGEPLQYIVGEWDFLGNPFYVGEGVLIPRPETELLCSLVIGEAKKIKPCVVFDLCAGSGCIGISVAEACPDARVCAVEKFDGAYAYLTRNIERHGLKNVTSVKADVLESFEAAGLPVPDIVVSNPPYVKRGELPGLQREVRREPEEALDGGADGLRFYRALAEKWFPFVNAGGLMAVECGEGQAADISGIFAEKGGAAEVRRDLQGTERIVIIRKEL